MSAPVLACTDATRLLAGYKAAIAAYDARRAYWQHVAEHQCRSLPAEPSCNRKAAQHDRAKRSKRSKRK